MLFYGPCGTGKTTLAGIIAKVSNSHFVNLNATNAGIGELRNIIEDARKRVRSLQQRTILFLDEIHRFNKSQQDVLLPCVEDGTIILIGATTENPFFEVNETAFIPFATHNIGGFDTKGDWSNFASCYYR
ncbi:MAG: AAA family ATPase [Veillonella sp.]